MTQLLTVKQVAERLNVPVSWVYERTRFDSFPGMVRIGKYIRFAEPEIESFIANGGEKAREPISIER